MVHITFRTHTRERERTFASWIHTYIHFRSAAGHADTADHWYHGQHMATAGPGPQVCGCVYVLCLLCVFVCVLIVLFVLVCQCVCVFVSEHSSERANLVV